MKSAVLTCLIGTVVMLLPAAGMAKPGMDYPQVQQAQLILDNESKKLDELIVNRSLSMDDIQLLFTYGDMINAIQDDIINVSPRPAPSGYPP